MSSRNAIVCTEEVELKALDMSGSSTIEDAPPREFVATPFSRSPSPAPLRRSCFSRMRCAVRLLSPTIEMDVGAADYSTAPSRLLSIEYVFGAAMLVYLNVYGFVILHRFCRAHASPLIDVVSPPNPILQYLGAQGYDNRLDNPFTAYCQELWIFALLSTALGVGSYVCRRLAAAPPAPGSAAAPRLTSLAIETLYGPSLHCIKSELLNLISSTPLTCETITATATDSHSGSPLTGRPTSRNTTLLPLLYTAAGLIFTTVLHGPHFFVPLLLTLANYVVFSRLQRWCPYWVFMTVMWTTHVSLLFIIELYEGFEHTYWLQYYFPTSIDSTRRALGPNHACKGLWPTRLRWYVAFRMTTLRLIAFNYDLWEATHSAARARERAAAKHDTACIECAQLREQNNNSASSLPAEASRCYKYRTECPRDPSDYSFVNYLAYVVFPPLYLAGPMSSFNAFVSYMRVPGTSMPPRAMAVYALRLLGLYLTEFVLLHFVFISALSSYTFLTIEMSATEQAHFFFYSLAYIWLKFSFIWKSSRLFAMFSGIEVPEDMPRCFSNTLTIREFWRDWHASFNLWIVRYMYVPMGGRARVALSVLPIFLFIALWHDPALHLLKWALCIAAMFVVELLVSASFHRVSAVFRREMATAAAAAAATVGGDAAAADTEEATHVAQRGSGGSAAAAVVTRLVLRPVAHFTARHVGLRARAWCYRMLRVLAGMSTVFGLIVANLIGFSMQNSTATIEKADFRNREGDADTSIARSLRNASFSFVAGLVMALYSLASLAAVDRDFVFYQMKMLKKRYGLA